MAIRDALVEEEQQAPEQEQERLSEEEEKDLEIAVNLAESLIDDGGYEVVMQAEQSSDPGQVVGQFLMQLASQMVEQLPEHLKPSPRVFFAVDGWVEQVSDYLQEEYDVPKEVMDRAEIFIASASQSMSQGQAAQQQQNAPVQPPMPEQGGMA